MGVQADLARNALFHPKGGPLRTANPSVSCGLQVDVAGNTLFHLKGGSNFQPSRLLWDDHSGNAVYHTLRRCTFGFQTPEVPAGLRADVAGNTPVHREGGFTTQHAKNPSSPTAAQSDLAGNTMCHPEEGQRQMATPKSHGHTPCPPWGVGQSCCARVMGSCCFGT